ncbi:fatty acid desaturase 5 [Actinidia rufa]|uniref:Fatty acid desaturase 5 n=1 Tax=Actinidia rufa TaxID=165716 RepID=A0A7J0FE45_9ERIC|nr:fatty acid desaturase 5 [Actinidia rufa]
MALISPPTNAKPYSVPAQPRVSTPPRRTTVIHRTFTNRNFKCSVIEANVVRTYLCSNNERIPDHKNRILPIACATPIAVAENIPEPNSGRIDAAVKWRRNVYWGRKWNSRDIGTAVVVVAMHLLCLLAPFVFNWAAIWVAVGLYVVTGLLGITLSFHRHLSHRSFKLPKWLEYFFAYCGVQALQGNPIDWVSTHRYHHQFCDSERDPHSPLEGFWFSHMSWLFDTNTVIERCGKPNNVGDLEKQPFYRFFGALTLCIQLHLQFCSMQWEDFPSLFGECVLWPTVGLTDLLTEFGQREKKPKSFLQYLDRDLELFPEGVRIVWVYHITLASKLSLSCVGKAGMGHPRSIPEQLHSERVGIITTTLLNSLLAMDSKWWQIDMTWYAVRLLQAIGLATDVKITNRGSQAEDGFGQRKRCHLKGNLRT